MTEEQRSWYQTAAGFYKNEIATLGWRTNVFTVAQSILVGGFILLLTKSSPLLGNKSLCFATGIAGVALVYCIVHHISGKSASTAAEFWRAYMYELEAPNKTENNPWVCDPWHALCKYYRREESQELRWFEVCKQSEEQNCQTSKTEQSKGGKSKIPQDKQFKAPPLYERKLLCIKPGPASWVILPAVFGLAWLIAAIFLLVIQFHPLASVTFMRILKATFVVIVVLSVMLALNKPPGLCRSLQRIMVAILRWFSN